MTAGGEMFVPAGCLVALVVVVVADNETKSLGKERAREDPHSTAKVKESHPVLSHPLAAKHTRPTHRCIAGRDGLVAWDVTGQRRFRRQRPLPCGQAQDGNYGPSLQLRIDPAAARTRDWRPGTPQGDGRSSGGRFMTCRLQHRTTPPASRLSGSGR